MASEHLTKENVSIQVTMYARPQLIAPEGRWSFHLSGAGFMVRPDFTPAYSPRGAVNAAMRLCDRLGFNVNGVNVEGQS